MNFCIYGVFFLLGHAAYWWLDPFQQHIPLFLGLFSSMFALYFFLISKIKKNKTVAPDIDRRNGLVILLFGAAFRLLLVPMTPHLSDDVYRYVWDGRVQQAGINPYRYPPAAEELRFLRDNEHPLINHPTIRTVYPPLAQLVFRLGTTIKSDVFTQKLIFTLLDIGVIGLLILWLPLRGRSRVWSLIYAWNPLCVLEFSTSGHNDSLMMLFWVLACYLFDRKRPASTYLSLAAAAMSKLIPLLMIPWMILNKNRRFVVLFLMAVGTIVIPFVFRPGFSSQGVQTYAKDWFYNPGLFAVLSGVIPNSFARKIAVGIVLILAAYLWAEKNQNNPALYAFGAVYALLLLSPVVHPWYVLWLTPFLCLYPLWSGLLWTWAVGFTYIVLIRYTTEGVWSLPVTIPILEYALVLGLLFMELRRGFYQPEWGTVTRAPVHKDKRSLSALRATVIIPALNEENALPLVIQDIPKEGVHEIIVVDNGSTDRTKAVAAAAGARVVDEPRRGYGQAVLTGMKNLDVSCDTVVVLDGDHSDFPEDLEKLLEPLVRNEADFVIGARTQAVRPGSLMPQQKFGNWLTCVLIRMLYGQRYTDMGPFRAIRRSALERLRMEDKNFGWNVEMQTKALQEGLRVCEVPVRYRPRIGTSKISGTFRGSFQAGVIILWSLYKYGWKSLSATSNK